MSIGLKLNDVFAMAIHIEQSGARFYREAAAGPNILESTRDMLNELAVMEDDHKQIFIDMQEGRADEPDKPAFATDSDAVLYLRAMTDGNIIGGDPDETTHTAKHGSISEILRMAIELEKDSIVFYLGLKEILVDETDRAMVDGIIREEMRHIVNLKTKLESV